MNYTMSVEEIDRAGIDDHEYVIKIAAIMLGERGVGSQFMVEHNGDHEATFDTLTEAQDYMISEVKHQQSRIEAEVARLTLGVDIDGDEVQRVYSDALSRHQMVEIVLTNGDTFRGFPVGDSPREHLEFLVEPGMLSDGREHVGGFLSFGRGPIGYGRDFQYIARIAVV